MYVNSQNYFIRANTIICAVGLCSITGYVGVAYSSNVLKYISVFTQIIALLLSISIINAKKKYIQWNLVYPVLIILFIYPILRLLLSATVIFTLKSFTDYLVVYGGYYQLIVIGLALGLLTNSDSIYYLLNGYAKFALPIGILLIGVFYLNHFYQTVGLSYIIIANCLIPISLLIYLPASRKLFILGWISLFAIFLIAFTVASRSYTLVGLMLLVLSIFQVTNSGTYKRFLMIILYASICYFLGLFDTLPIVNIIDKFQFEDLSYSFNKFIQNGDVKTIYYWRGNSRAGVLEDAFGEFGIMDIIFGKGIMGVYASFVTRHTIEVGWAQEIFRWGILYLLAMFTFICYAVSYLKKRFKKTRSIIFSVFSTIIFIRFIDGFIYGVPETSVYNLYFYWGLMLSLIKVNKVIYVQTIS